MNTIKYFLLGLLALSILVSCNDEIPLTIQDEFLGIDASSTQKLYLRQGLNQPVPAEMRAMLIAPQRSTPTNVSFEILPTSSAILNLHYRVTGNTTQIPANASFGELPIQIFPDNIEPGEMLTLAVRITGGDLAVANEFSTVTFRIQVLCPNTIPLDRTWTVTIVEGAFGATGVSRNDVTIRDAGDGTFLVSDITAGVLPLLGCCDRDEDAYIRNICDVITIDRRGAKASFNYRTDADEGYGPGSWDASTRTLTLPWWEPANGFGAVVVFRPN